MFSQNQQSKIKQIVKTYRNKFNKLKKSAEKIYYDNKFVEYKGNLKTTWKLQSSIPPDPKEIADKFSNNFVNVGPNLAEKNPEKKGTKGKY